MRSAASDEAIDVQRGYDEQRFTIIGRAASDLLVVVYTERGDRIRIISARRAERAEPTLATAP
jgi:uncharacterized DUF497 family protein